jgi:type I restriction enzyme S subunit
MVVRGMILAHSFPVGVTTKAVAFNQDIKALSPSAAFVPDFLLHWLVASRQQILRLVDVANHGTRRLPSDELFELDVPVPPLGEQERICEVIAAIDERFTSEVEFLDQLKATKSALVAALLSGEIRVSPYEASA